MSLKREEDKVMAKRADMKFRIGEHHVLCISSELELTRFICFSLSCSCYFSNEDAFARSVSFGQFQKLPQQKRGQTGKKSFCYNSENFGLSAGQVNL